MYVLRVDFHLETMKWLTTTKKNVSTTHSTEFWLWKLWEKSITHVNHIHTNKSMSSNVRTHRAKDFFSLFSFTSMCCVRCAWTPYSSHFTVSNQKRSRKKISKKTNISILMFSLSQRIFSLVFFYLTNLTYKLFIKFFESNEMK